MTKDIVVIIIAGFVHFAGSIVFGIVRPSVVDKKDFKNRTSNLIEKIKEKLIKSHLNLWKTLEKSPDPENLIKTDDIRGNSVLEEYTSKNIYAIETIIKLKKIRIKSRLYNIMFIIIAFCIVIIPIALNIGITAIVSENHKITVSWVIGGILLVLSIIFVVIFIHKNIKLEGELEKYEDAEG